MRIKSLHLENIGPFVEADLEFMTDGNTKPPVVLITGENGTGKSIILDAIRGIFGQHFTHLYRDIRRRNSADSAKIEALLDIDRVAVKLQSQRFLEEFIDPSQEESELSYRIEHVPFEVKQGKNCPNWIVDFWPSILASGSYKVNTLSSPNHKGVFQNSLSGEKVKTNITQLICHFDYLRDSRDEREKATGEKLYAILGEIIARSLLEGGHLSHVARATYEPVVVQNGQAVGLEQLSSGNSYLIQDMVELLGKMYSIHILRQTDISELCQTPGLLLIDEAENQLHPKWQKRFIRSILEIFPNLQIIATTHSPFIISSVEDARLFVCKVEGDRCIVTDETAEYSNKPVDEILMSPLFEETQPFNEEITDLIEQRKQAILTGNTGVRTRIESKLKALNPEYFAYFDLDQLLETALAGEKLL
jgi:predicted ATP-binding protein involved in virulence